VRVTVAMCMKELILIIGNELHPKKLKEFSKLGQIMKLLDSDFDSLRQGSK
jgi:BRCT domain type II-containing protein